MKKLMIALTLATAGFMAAQTPAPAAPAPTKKVKKHKVKKTAAPAAADSATPAKK